MSDIEELLQLTEYGLKIIPIYHKTKIPKIKEWQNNASSDPEQIAKWAEWNSNWGVVTGEVSDVFVVDIDPTHGGFETWDALVAQHGEPLKTVTTRTGTGGIHLYFKLPPDVIIGNNAGKIGKGIDVRGNNGQVLIPPSIHPNGNPYSWLHSPQECEVARPPSWLINLISKPVLHEDFSKLGEDMEVGSRNDSIYHQSLVLARNGANKDFAMTAMQEWCKTTGNNDIGLDEITATVDSAYKKAEEEPKQKKKKSSSADSLDIGKTDYDNATRLIDKHGDVIRYVPGMGWFVWDGKIWYPDDENALMTNLTVDTMRDIRDNALSSANDPQSFRLAFAKAAWATQSMNLARIKATIEMASKEQSLRLDVDDMDGPQTKFYLNVKNGTIDLRTGELHEFKKSQLITKVVDYMYDPEAECPTWLETLELAFDGNKDLIEFMQRAIGYSLTGSTAEQCLFICWGESGNNGKSTILETIQRLLGRGYAQMSDMKVITSQSMDNRVASSLAKLQGVRIVSMNEAEEYQKISESLVKQMTGGDTLQACKKYKEPFEFVPVFKLWIRTNEKPSIRGAGEAMWRRIKLIPFDKPIPKEKRKSRDVVDAALTSETEGILKWAVDGAVKWYNDGGLKEPKEVTDATSEYKDEMDIISMFFDECVYEDETAYVTRNDFYRAFTSWCKQNGYKFVMTSRSFGRRVAIKIDQHERDKVGGQYVWRGIDLYDVAKVGFVL